MIFFRNYALDCITEAMIQHEERANKRRNVRVVLKDKHYNNDVDKSRKATQEDLTEKEDKESKEIYEAVKEIAKNMKIVIDWGDGEHTNLKIYNNGQEVQEYSAKLPENYEDFDGVIKESIKALREVMPERGE